MFSISILSILYSAILHLRYLIASLAFSAAPKGVIRYKYEDLFGFFSGVKINTEDNYKNIENWQELKTFYEQNKDFCHFDL